jgi:integrase
MARQREALEGKFREPGLKDQVARDTKSLPEGRHKLRCDGRGLYIRVAPPNGASWVFRYMTDGKSRTMGLGRYPDLSLSAAREEALSKRRLLLNGIDPIDQKKDEKRDRQKTRDAAKTFKECAEAYIKAQEPGWKHEKTGGQWRASLATYVYSLWGEDMGVAVVDTPDVLRVLNQVVDENGGTLWNTHNVTAGRVRERIEAILESARVKGLRTGDNPARWKGHLSHDLPPPSSVANAKNQPALPYTLIGEFMAKLRRVASNSALALEFLILTAVRSDIVAGATWGEFDLDAKEWLIPAERMKGKKGKSQAHRVPLSDPAVLILRRMLKLARKVDGKPDPAALVFPGTNGKMSDATMRKTCKGLGYKEAPADGDKLVVPHGFRSTFRTWGGETGVEEEIVLEAALAHAQSGIVPTYQRGTMFDRRRKVMDKWAVACAQAKPAKDLKVAA